MLAASVACAGALGAVAVGSAAAAPAEPAPIARQEAYAMAHWDHYDTAVYGNLNPVGGDCADFVSQTLLARGWRMNAAWHDRDGGSDWSPAWGYVPSMNAYFAANAHTLGLTEYPLSDRSHIRVGDIVMFDLTGDGTLGHVEMVSRVEQVNGRTVIEMAAHNRNVQFSNLDTVLREYPHATGHFWHVALPATTAHAA